MKEYLFVAFAQGHMTYFESMQIDGEEDKIKHLMSFSDDLADTGKADYVVYLSKEDIHKLCVAASECNT